MTEIPEEAALRKRVLQAVGETLTSEGMVGHALDQKLTDAVLSALPHLRVQETRDGLRDALKELAEERDSISGHSPSDYHIRPYELFDLLAAHPTPAPRPVVDREALALKAKAWEEGWRQGVRDANRPNDPPSTENPYRLALLPTEATQPADRSSSTS